MVQRQFPHKMQVCFCSPTASTWIMIYEVLFALVGVGLLPVGGEGAQPLLVPALAVAGLRKRTLIGHATVRATA